MNEQPEPRRSDRPTVLILVEYYTPAYKGGGPIRTISNIVNRIGEDISFKILTKDRDFEDARPFANVVVNKWHTVGNAQVLYLSPDRMTISSLRGVLNATEYDVLYINSFFSPLFSICPMLLRKLRLIPRRPVVLAPRGEFSPGALNLKYPKKRLFIWIGNVLRLYSGITWQASSEMEQKDIERWFPCPLKARRGGSRVQIALALSPACSLPENKGAPVRKTSGSLNIIFLSRITAMKNLDYALNVLKELRGTVTFDIYGPIDRDKEYWEACNRIIAELPSNVTVNYKGAVKQNEVRDTFSQYHVFLFPTRGENFGHVIMESLSAGCPVILSDQTPWRDLEEKGVGWDIPLSHPEKFRSVLEQLIEMGEDEFNVHAQHAVMHAFKAANDRNVLEQNLQLFLQAQS